MVLGSGDFGRWSGCEGGVLRNGLCCCCSVAKLCLTLCDPVDYSMSGSPVLDYLQVAKLHVHWTGDHHLLPSSAYAFNLSQHQGLFQWIGSSHPVAILKSRDITLSTKVRLVKAMVFPVVIYGCESWTIKKAEHWRINAFELWCWRRLLRVPWTARRYNESIVKEISPEYSLEELILSWNYKTLATWCEELTHWKRPWFWERLKLGEEGDNRRWHGGMVSSTQWTWV